MTSARRSPEVCRDAPPPEAAAGVIAGREYRGHPVGTGSDPAGVLWDPGSHRGQSRLLFIARPGPGIRAALDAALAAHRLSPRLGRSEFDPGNWHQSVSDRYIDTPELRRELLQVGDSISAPATTLRLDRIQSPRNQRGSFNWELRGHPSERDLLVPLVTEIKRAAVAHNLPASAERNRPHITLSYGAGSALPSDLPIEAIEWTIDAIELVVGNGKPYRYTTLGRWPLRPEAPRIIQRALF